MSPSGTPKCEGKETPTIKGELENLSASLGQLEGHVDGIVSITGVMPVEETAKDPRPAGAPIVQERIAEIKALKERVHRITPMIIAVRTEIDRIC